MITDEIIFETAVVYEEPAELWQGQIVFNKHSLLEYTRRIIALAKEVRPLEWARLDHFDTWIAPGIDYDYIIPIAGDFYHLHYGDELPCSSNSIDELKKAAQADFNRRVLENLTHGVADEN